MWEQGLGLDHPQVAFVLNNRAMLFMKQVRGSRAPYSISLQLRT